MCYDFLIHRHPVFDYCHCIGEVYHGLLLLEGDDGIGIQSAYLYHALQVSVGVVLLGWCPSVDDKADSPTMMLLYVSLQQLERCSVSLLHGSKLFESPVSIRIPLPLPVVSYTYIQGIVVSYSSWILHKIEN